MPKHKKTRKQKLLADSRRLRVTSPSLSLGTKAPLDGPNENTYTFDKSLISKPAGNVNKQQPANQNKISTLDYSYLRSDLQKTILLTLSIVIIDLLIKFLVKGA